MKKSLQIILATIFTCLLFTGTAVAQPDDIKGHWAEAQINKWIDDGLAKGYQDGTFKPNATITRAEFITLVNRAFRYGDPVAINYSDVSSKDWFAGEVACAKAAGYVGGYSDGSIKPNNPISRQEVASMLTRILKIDATGGEVIGKFKDYNAIPQWSASAINSVVAKGYMSGYPDQTFKPGKFITRAEAIATLDRANNGTPVSNTKPNTDVIYDKAGDYGSNNDTEIIKGNAIIKVSHVSLKNLIIEGNLLLDTGIGEGSVNLINVQVKGSTSVEGGGPNSINLVNSALGKVIVSKKQGSVRIVSSGTTKVVNVEVGSSVKLEELNSSGEGFGDVVVKNSIPTDATVKFAGAFKQVTVDGKKVNIEMESGSIDRLNLSNKAMDTVVNLAKNTSINNLILDSATRIKGNGKITNAYINVSGSIMEQEPEKINYAEGVTAEIGGSPAAGGGGGAAGGGAGTVDTTPPEITEASAVIGGKTFSVNKSTGKIKVTGVGDKDKLTDIYLTASEDATLKFMLSPEDILLKPGNNHLIMSQIMGPFDKEGDGVAVITLKDYFGGPEIKLTGELVDNKGNVSKYSLGISLP